MASFPYLTTDKLPTSLMPRLPLTIALGSQSVGVVGLLDTGAAVSVLPFQIGLTLGAVWEEQTTVVPLVGSLGEFEARVLIVKGTHPQIIPNKTVRLDTIGKCAHYFWTDELFPGIRRLLLSLSASV